MNVRVMRPAGRSVIALGALLVVLGLAMPTIATEFIHDPAPRAQEEVDRAKLNLFFVTINLGTKVSVFGAVENLSDIVDLDFIPDNFPLPYTVMRLKDFDGLIIFRNSLGFVVGDIAVAEGYYYSLSFNNTTYSIVTLNALPSLAFAFVPGLQSEAVSPTKVFRPWWGSTGLMLTVLGAVGVASGAAVEGLVRRAAPKAQALPPAPPPAPPPTPPNDPPKP